MPTLLHKPTGRIFPFIKTLADRADMEVVAAPPVEGKKPRAARAPKFIDVPIEPTPEPLMGEGVFKP